MIKLVTNLFTQTKKVSVKKMNEDVNQFILPGYQATGSKVFSSADLWSIQRKRKTFVQRRWSF